MSNVSHVYGAQKLRRQVLFDVSCDIWPGEIVIVTGPSGSGKTTVLTLVGALRSVQQGSLKIFGEELRGARRQTLMRVRERVGFIFQLHNLLDCLTARQNVELAMGLEALPRGESRERATAMLEAVGLGDQLDQTPRQLSGGQRQRVAVARALVRHPKIVLADEPTAALDKHSGRDVVELLRQLARREGCAVLLVTHDNRILDIADRIMTLEDGRMRSFTGASSPHAGHLLTALSYLTEQDLEAFLSPAAEGEFLELMKVMAAECEQLLNVLDMGDRESVRRLFQNVLTVTLGKIVRFLAAEEGILFLLREGSLHLAASCGTPSQFLEDLANRALKRGEIVNLSGGGLMPLVRNVLCVPLQARYSKVPGVALFVNRHGNHFTQADERAFHDFAGPLGIIMEGCERVTRTH